MNKAWITWCLGCGGLSCVALLSCVTWWAETGKETGQDDERNTHSDNGYEGYDRERVGDVAADGASLILDQSLFSALLVGGVEQVEQKVEARHEESKEENKKENKKQKERAGGASWGWRSDLAVVLSGVVCGGAIDRFQSRFFETLYGRGGPGVMPVVEDAGSYVGLLRFVTEEDLKILWQVAEQVMLEHHHYGLIAGRCAADGEDNGGYVWLYTMPSPVASRSHGLRRLVENHCRGVRVHVVQEDGVRRREAFSGQGLAALMEEWHDLHTRGQEYLAASLVCLPRQPSWMGDQTWFVIRGQMQDPILAQVFDGDDDDGPNGGVGVFDRAALLDVMQQVRLQAGVAPLRWGQGLFSSMAAGLAHRQTMVHDHHALQRLLKRAQRDDAMLFALAEIRVIASSAREAVENILGSPSHREALLHPRAYAVSVHTVSVQGSPEERFVVILLKKRAG